MTKTTGTSGLVRLLVTAFLGIAPFMGCTVGGTDFTFVSTKNLRLNVEKGKRVSGSDCGVFSIDMKRAIDNAIDSAGEPQADSLIDGKVTQISYIFWACYKVEGNVVSSKNVRPIAHIEPNGHFRVAMRRQALGNKPGGVR